MTNQILGTQKAQIGEISQKNKKGKNTTTDVTLYEIEADTYLLDTPGFQAIDIFEIETKNLSEYMIDLKPYIKNCEYIGCTHIKEENCGIKKAVEEGEIQKIRYENYKIIYQELKEREENKWKK
ncbi:MAG: ribosome small subunit-dependent GTPase A [Clostridia bacterium]|nr:ribosome small subunit-dependent GTPase A [Clostridia bacterium]